MPLAISVPLPTAASYDERSMPGTPTQPNEPRRRMDLRAAIKDSAPTLWVSGAILLALLLSPLALNWYEDLPSQRWRKQIPFDSHRWQTEGRTDHDLRARMVASAIGFTSFGSGAKRLDQSTFTSLQGKTRAEIEQMFGPPDSEGDFYVHYLIGLLDERGWLQEEFALIIHFRYGIVTDVTVSD